MRMSRMAATLIVLATTIGGVHAASNHAGLRISMTIVDRCDVRHTGASPSVDCSAGVPWTVAAPAAPAAPSLVADGGPARHFPVPRSGPVDEARVTTIVF
jgi:hypothetical protein